MNGKSHQLAAAVRVARLLRAALRSSALPAVVMFWAKIVKTFAGRGSTDHLTRGARRAQEHADLHRLHVLTTYYARDGDGEALLNDVLAGAEGKSYEQLKASVSDNLTSQIRTICAAVRASLTSPRVPPRVGPRGGGGGGGKVLKDRRSPRERGRMGSSLARVAIDRPIERVFFSEGTPTRRSDPDPTDRARGRDDDDDDDDDDDARGRRHRTHQDVTHAPKRYTSALPPFLCVRTHFGSPPSPATNSTLPGMANAAFASSTILSFSADARTVAETPRRAAVALRASTATRRPGATRGRAPTDASAADDMDSARRRVRPRRPRTRDARQRERDTHAHERPTSSSRGDRTDKTTTRSTRRPARHTPARRVTRRRRAHTPRHRITQRPPSTSAREARCSRARSRPSRP